MSDQKDIGNLGENLALKFLIQKNYLILAKNYTIYGGEIDIIVQDLANQDIVFVEVKTRRHTDYGWPEQAFNTKKRQRMMRTASQYLKEIKAKISLNYRFDIISVELNLNTRLSKISHFKGI